jgi:hypothetical protein
LLGGGFHTFETSGVSAHARGGVYFAADSTLEAHASYVARTSPCETSERAACGSSEERLTALTRLRCECADASRESTEAHGFPSSTFAQPFDLGDAFRGPTQASPDTFDSSIGCGSERLGDCTDSFASCTPEAFARAAEQTPGAPEESGVRFLLHLLWREKAEVYESCLSTCHLEHVLLRSRMDGLSIHPTILGDLDAVHKRHAPSLAHRGSECSRHRWSGGTSGTRGGLCSSSGGAGGSFASSKEFLAQPLDATPDRRGSHERGLNPGFFLELLLGDESEVAQGTTLPGGLEQLGQ